MRSSYLGRQNYWFPIEKCEIEILRNKRSASSSIKRNQFHVALTGTFTVHRVQVVRVEQSVVDFDLQKQKSFGPRQIYCAQ